MAKYIKIGPGVFWSIVANHLNDLPAIKAKSRTSRYSATLLQQYFSNTYRPCPKWLRSILKVAIKKVKADLKKKGIVC